VCVGVGLNNTNTSLIGPALDMAKDADVVLLFIGDGNEQVRTTTRHKDNHKMLAIARV
jgi:hypothetical protein